MCLVVNRRRCHMSASGSSALVRRCGFATDESYMAFPGRHRFTALGPLAAGRSMLGCIDLLVEGDAFRERRKRAWLKILAVSGLIPYFSQEYIVIGRKEA